jgi:hypothetical protein
MTETAEAIISLGDAPHSLAPAIWQLLSLIPVGVIVTILLNLAARSRSNKDLTIKLHEAFLSPDFYAKVRAPAYHVGLQWRHLTGEVNTAYRCAVVAGWAFDLKSDKLVTYVSDSRKLRRTRLNFTFSAFDPQAP